ncbi:MAG: NAD(+) diphosphatase [Spirochaetota bacterium]
MIQQIFVFAGQDLMVRDRGASSPSLDGASIQGLSTAAKREFPWMKSSCVALSLDALGMEEALVRGLVPVPIRQAIGAFPAEFVRPVLKGLALLNWLEGARFCGACGTALVDVGGEDPGKEPSDIGSRLCPSCRRPHFPRISPAVIVLVRKGGRALLARNARMPPGGRFGLLAGFVEVGETLEETALREVREESGIEIQNLRYVSSQPWPFPDSLMLAYTADWRSGEARPDGVEIAELRWCGPDDLPEIPPKGSVARALIDEFVRQGA